MQNAQLAQAKARNKKITLRNFKIENQVMLFIKNLKNARLKKKLFYKFIELFEIENIVNSQTYCFRLSKYFVLFQSN